MAIVRVVLANLALVSLVIASLACSGGLPVNVRAFGEDGASLARPLCFLPAEDTYPGAPLEFRGMYRSAVEACAARAKAHGVVVVDFGSPGSDSCLPTALSWVSVPEGSGSKGGATCFGGGYGMQICRTSSESAPRYRKGLTMRVFDSATPAGQREVYVVSTGAESRSASMKARNFHFLCDAAFQQYPRTGESVLAVSSPD